MNMNVPTINTSLNDTNVERNSVFNDNRVQIKMICILDLTLSKTGELDKDDME